MQNASLAHTPRHRGIRSLAGAACALAALLPLGARSAEPMAAFLEAERGVNIIALAAGSVPDHPGSDDRAQGLAPLVRLQLSGERYVQWVGTEFSWNVLDDPDWRAGPVANWRAGRKQVQDGVISAMSPVDGGWEFGAFVSRVWRFGQDPRQNLTLGADVLAASGAHSGAVGSVRLNYFHPVSRALLVNVGLGRGWGSADYHDAYFGVKGQDVALFPSLQGQPFRPGSGWTDWRLTYGAVLHLSPSWHLVAGGRVQWLDDRVAKSPVVAERGKRVQHIVGVGVGYVWQ